METELERLMVRLVGDGSSYQRMIEQAHASTERFTERLQYHSARVAGMGLVLRGWGTSVLGVAAGFATVAGIGSVLESVKKGIEQFAEHEKTDKLFATLTGGAEQAERVIGGLKKYASESPFTLAGLEDAAQRMIAFGGSAGSVVSDLRMLGDVAAATGGDIGHLSSLYARMQEDGKASSYELQHLARMNVPIWQELEKVTGKTHDELKKLAASGHLGFKSVQTALENLTKEGGKFHGAAASMNDTLAGLFKTLQGQVNSVLGNVGHHLVESLDLKGVLRGLIDGAKEAGRWVNFLADQAVEAGHAVREFLGTTGVKAFYDVVDAVRDWVDENRKLVLGLGLAAGAVAGVAVAYRVLQSVLMTTLSVAMLLRLNQVAEVALWAAVKLVVLAATAAKVAYTATVWAMNAAMAAATFLYGLFAAGEIWATIQTWLLNAALAVLNAEMIVPLVVGLAAAVLVAGAFALALAVVGSAAYAAYKAGSQVLDVLLKFPTDSGPLKAVGDVFKGWVTDLGRIADVAKKDLPGAFELLKLRGQLAVSEVRDAWPPMVDFLRKSLGAVWQSSAQVFELYFKQAILNVVIEALKLFLMIARTVSPAIGEGMENDLDKLEKKSTRITSQIAKNTGNVTAAQIRQFARDMDNALKDSGTTTELRKKVADAFDYENLKLRWREAWAKMGGDAAADTKRKFEETPLKMHVTPKFDAAAWNSAEAATRIAEFRDRLGLNPAGHGPTDMKARTVPFGGGVVGPGLQAGDGRNLFDYPPNKSKDDVYGADWNPRTVFDDIRSILKEIRDGKSQGDDVGDF